MLQEDTDITSLARNMASRDAKVRASANSTAAALDDDDRSQLLRALIDNHSEVMRWVPLILLWALVPLFVWMSLPSRVSDSTQIAVLSLSCCFVPVICYISLGPSKRISNAITAATILKGDYSRAVGSLMVATNYQFSRSTRNHVYNLLEKVVDDLVPGEPCGLTPAQAQSCVEHVVITWSDSRQVASPATDAPIRFVPRTMTMVKLLSKVGNHHQMETLERLSQRRVTNDTQVHIRDLILELLPGWKARLAEQAAPGTLLRGALSPEAPDTLLRSTGGEIEIAAAELLRATEQQERSL